MISVDSILSEEHDVSKLNKLCRLCGHFKETSALIFDDIHQQNFDDIINIYFKAEFQITQDDILPLKICQNCLTAVESWNQFYISCVCVNEKFLQLVEKFNLKKKIEKKPNDMMNNDIEVIEVSVEDDNYDFFNDPVDTHQFDISKLEFTHSASDNFQGFDNVENITFSDDTVVKDANDQLPTNETEYTDGKENTTSVVLDVGDNYADSNVDDETKGIDEADLNDSDGVENDTTLPSALPPAPADVLEELQADDENRDTTELDSTLYPLRCSLCSNIAFSGRLIGDQFVCENCCKVKLESNDDDQWNYEDQTAVANGEQSDSVVTSQNLSEKGTATVLGGSTVDLTAMKALPDEKYQCALCNKVYCKKKSMINHVNNHNKKIFTCQVCHSNFRTLALLKTHRKRHVRKSMNNTLIYCEICKKYFKTKKGFAYHQQKICIQYKCYICDEKFLVHSVLMDHMRMVHDDAKKQLSIVGVATSAGDAERIASVKAMPAAPANDNETVMSVCPICHKVVTQAVLPRHMILHSEDKPFTCDMCGKSFKRKHSLQDHIMIEMGMKNYVCDICGMKFLKQGYLNKHVRYHQLNNGEYQGFRCEMCGKKFPEKWRLGVHQRSVHKGGRFSSCKCDICGNMFAERWMVRRHKAQEHNGEEFREYQCDVCGKKFQEKWMIRSHQRSTHKTGVRKLYCDLCGRSDHLQKDCTHRHAIHEVTCELCGELFQSNYALKEHVTSTHNFDQISKSESLEEPLSNQVQDTKKNVHHICSGCGKQFVNKQLLRQHKVAGNCGIEMKYECEECGKVFHSKSSLSNHLMSHKEAAIPAIFRCEFCKKKFRNNESLDAHMSGDKLCLVCGKVYPCDDQLRNHVYKEHDDEDEDSRPVTKKSRTSAAQKSDEWSQDEAETINSPNETQPDKPFECRLCHKKFPRKQAMKNHFYAELNLRRHECAYCDKSYNYYSHLKEHIITNHGEKEYSCVHCGKDFPTRKRFRDHVSLHLEEKPFLCICGLSFKLNRYLSKHKKKCKATIKEDIE